MKTKTLLRVTSFMLLLSLMSCSDDDEHGVAVPGPVSQALKAKYPSAKAVKWGIKGNYYVADCRVEGNELDVWFGKQADWVLTEMDITWDNLAPVVQTAFLSSEYADWKTDEFTLLEYPLHPLQYVIEVEQGKTKLQLFYSESGALMQTRDVTDSDDTHWPLIYSG